MKFPEKEKIMNKESPQGLTEGSIKEKHEWIQTLQCRSTLLCAIGMEVSNP